MSNIRLLLSAGVFALGAAVAQSSQAQPEGGKPGPARGPAGPAQAAGGNKPPGGQGADRKPNEARGKGKGSKPGDKGDDARKGKDKDKDKDKGKGKSSRAKGKSKYAEANARRRALQEKRSKGKLTPEEQSEFDKLWDERMERVKRFKSIHYPRYVELLEKQREGELSTEEAAELRKVEKSRNRYRKLKRSHAKHDKNRKRRIRAARRALLRTYPGLLADEKARAELRKHARREAMLERALEIAHAEGLDDQVLRAKRLIAKERIRHQTWMKQNMGGKKPGDKK